MADGEAALSNRRSAAVHVQPGGQTSRAVTAGVAIQIAGLKLVVRSCFRHFLLVCWVLAFQA